MTIRTRFAPSPTGYLHIGSARTALFCWLFARKNKGKFLLRIEDTDVERSTQASIEAIIESMEWLKLDYDEGPFYQTQRFDRYREVATQLLNENKAYRCYCTKERLEKLREQQIELKQKPRYDGHCRNLSDQPLNQAHVIRFRNPETGSVIFNDQVFGQIEVENEELDDLIIVRSDGVPTYNFCVVVDDWDMKISHVIRGDDHINNTPRQINILNALGANIPLYAHVPMILGPDGKRLSKRHGAVSVLQYRDEGFLSDALINYLVRLGWSHGDQEIFSRNEMIEYFDIKDVNKAAAAFNPEKLLWLNHYYLKHRHEKELEKDLEFFFKRSNIDLKNGPDLKDILKTQIERCKTLIEIVDKSSCFYQDEISFDKNAADSYLTPNLLAPLETLSRRFEELNSWSEEAIQDLIVNTAEVFKLNLGKLAQPLRVAVTGNTISPGISTTVFLLGKERVLQRLEKSISFIKAET